MYDFTSHPFITWDVCRLTALWPISSQRSLSVCHTCDACVGRVCMRAVKIAVTNLFTFKLIEFCFRFDHLIVCNDFVSFQSDDHGFSPLHWCAKEGHTKLVEMLLHRGARVNATNMGDDIPLHLAAAHGHLDIVLLVRAWIIHC